MDEYKTAAEAMNHKEGCTSIPMNIRDKCTRASDFVEQE